VHHRGIGGEEQLLSRDIATNASPASVKRFAASTRYSLSPLRTRSASPLAVIPPTAGDRRKRLAGQYGAMGEDSRSGEREPDTDDIASVCSVTALLDRLVAAGEISCGDADLLIREWASFLAAERAEATCEVEYWSLRLTRDLADALGTRAISIAPGLEHELERLEEALVTGFMVGV
jgi:hypothetical protein